MKDSELMYSSKCRRRFAAVLLAVIVLLGFARNLCAGTVAAYPLPSIYTNSATYSLKAGGTNIPVVSYTSDYDYAEFSVSAGPVAIEVTALTQSSISSYGISPMKLGIAG